MAVPKAQKQGIGMVVSAGETEYTQISLHPCISTSLHRSLVYMTISLDYAVRLLGNDIVQKKM